MISLTIPIRTVSEANMREHWRSKHKRSKSQRDAVRWHLWNNRALHANVHAALTDGLVVLLTRIAPRSLDRHDNLPRCFKAMVDQIAEWLGVNDNDPRVGWRYAQERGKPKEYAVRIEIDQARQSERRTA